ncbi:MAG: type III restriction endonuclease subunit R, partial [bacterium]
MEEKLDEKRLAEVVKETAAVYVKLSIDIPRIVLVPTGAVTCGYRDFDLDTSSINQKPVANDILIQTLRENKQYRLVSLASGKEERLENYLVRGLIDYD